MALRMRHTMWRCSAMHRLRISTGSTCAARRGETRGRGEGDGVPRADGEHVVQRQTVRAAREGAPDAVFVMTARYAVHMRFTRLAVVLLQRC